MNTPDTTRELDVPSDVGVVVIGRNEGERLCRCIQSLSGARVVYVDSGSTDQSVAMAQGMGAEVVRLDPNKPFTAARARNAGLNRLIANRPHIQFIQFVDGDCEMDSRWLHTARQELLRHENVAVVCGRRRESSRDASIYNRLCDMEWNAPVGNVAACGGDAMMRVSALRDVAGFRDSMIAGEEPELCIRLRARRWQVLRIAADMTRHDADIRFFSQWWRRSVRAGHAIAETAWLHGRTETRSLRRVASVLVWALALPLLSIAWALPTGGLSLLGLPFAYAVLGWRVYRSQRLRHTACDRALYAPFVVIGKFAELAGMLRFWIGLIARRRAGIIEYKTPLAAPEPETP